MTEIIDDKFYVFARKVYRIHTFGDGADIGKDAVSGMTLKSIRLQRWALAACFLSLSPAFSVLAQSAPFGHEIGGQIQNTESLLDFEKGFFFSHQSYADADIDFFDEVVLGVDGNDTIESIVAMKGYSVSVNNVGVMKRKIKNDFIGLVDQLESEYGDADRKDAERIYGIPGDTNMFYLTKAISERVIIANVKDSNVEVISVFLSSNASDDLLASQDSEVLIYVAYLSDVVVDRIQKRKESKFGDLQLDQFTKQICLHFVSDLALHLKRIFADVGAYDEKMVSCLSLLCRVGRLRYDEQLTKS